MPIINAEQVVLRLQQLAAYNAFRTWGQICWKLI